MTPSGAGRGGEQRLGLVGHALGVGHQVEGPHQLPALGAVLAPHPGVRAPLGLAVADGGGVHHRPHSTMCWATRLPSLDANHFSVSHAW